jgi:hypothetical protein
MRIAPIQPIKVVKSEDREIRVFISSPFKDMQEERDQIVKHVIPVIRKLCAERDVTFSFVDLRWGVTGIQVQRERERER